MRFRKLDIEDALSRQEITWEIMDILLRVRRNAANLDEKIASETPASRRWKNRWFPDALTLFAQDNLERREDGRARMHECVETFREWASSNLNSAYDYARAPDGAIRGGSGRRYRGSGSR